MCSTIRAERLSGSDSQEVIAVLSILGPVESVYGDLDTSEQQLRRALDLQTRLLPPATAPAEQMLQLAVLENQLGVVLMRAKRFEEAITYQQQSVAHYEQQAGLSDSRTLAASKNLAFAYRMTERTQEARSLFEQVLEQERTLYGAPHWQIAYSLGHLANLAADEKDYERALVLWQEAEEITRAAMGDDYYWLDNARIGRASVLLQLGRKEEGLAVLHEFLEAEEPNPPMVRRAQELLRQHGE